MKKSITLIVWPTEEATIVNGARCRVWVGTTPKGTRVALLVALVRSGDPSAHEEFEGILEPMTPVVEAAGAQSVQ